MVTGPPDGHRVADRRGELGLRTVIARGAQATAGLASAVGSAHRTATIMMAPKEWLQARSTRKKYLLDTFGLKMHT